MTSAKRETHKAGQKKHETSSESYPVEGVSAKKVDSGQDYALFAPHALGHLRTNMTSCNACMHAVPGSLLLCFAAHRFPFSSLLCPGDTRHTKTRKMKSENSNNTVDTVLPCRSVAHLARRLSFRRLAAA